MINIFIKNSNQCQVEGPLKILTKLYNDFRIKHPDAWHILMRQRGKNRWDGYIKYINERGFFKIGLLPKVVETLKSYGINNIKIIDERPPLEISPVIPKVLGDKTLFPIQRKALDKLLNYKILDTPFRICVGDYAVGFGKSLLFCAIHEAYKRKIPTILLLNDSDLFNQFKREIPPLLPNEDIVFIQGSKVNRWGNFNVAMVQSISRNIRKYQMELSKIGIVLIDEADIIDNKTYKVVIEHLYNTQIRIGLSGTIYLNKAKKYIVHNMNIMSFIGNKVDQVNLSDQIKSGRATPVIVKMIDCTNFKIKIEPEWDYQEEYNQIIINNIESYKKSISRIEYNAKYNRFPMVIVTKYIKHCEELYKYCCKINQEKNYGWKINYAHHEIKNREKIFSDLREGKLDILIVTTIISRGKNFPQLRYLQNIASMDSHEKSIQILGRLVRKFEGKNKTYLDDFIFPGKYLKRHGNHRKIYYQKQKLKVITVKPK